MGMKNCSTLLLLAISIALAGCQTTTTAQSKVMPQYEEIRTMQVEIDSDGDGVRDDIDEYPEASVFIFGHAATNEIDEDLATLGFDSLSRNRALSIKDTLVLQHHIDAKRIRTYKCSNKLLVREADYINPSFKALNMKGLEAKQRRATLMASSSVNDLMSLKYKSDVQRYGEYAKHCELFE